MIRSLMWRGLLVAVAVMCAPGCSSSSSVSGEVTFEGRPVDDGAINFLPADGKGPVVGDKIIDGRYSVTGMIPGPKVVQISAVKPIDFARSSEEMEKMSAAAKARGEATGIIERADVIAPDAVGNNARVEVKPGAQTLNFALSSPARKTR